MLKALKSCQIGTHRQQASVVRLTSANLTLSRSVASTWCSSAVDCM